jgi:osmotically-inducible protein OsmY
MGWLKRIFGTDKPAGATTKVTMGKAKASAPSAAPANAEPEEIPAYRVGLTGEYDDSGLAKRVALAFDEDTSIDDVDTVWVAQLSGKVVLKGKVPSQAILDKMVTVAKGVDGAESVDTAQVEVG